MNIVMRKVEIFRVFALALVMITVTVAAQASDLMDEARGIFKPIPDSAPAIAGNPASAIKVELGKMLFFEPRISKSGFISCNSCHNVGMGGVDYQPTSTGHGWKQGPRNAPTVLNSVFNVAQFWDGRAKDLAEQAKGPVQAGVEMNNTPANVVKTLKSMPEYINYFKMAFPGESDPVTFDNMALAIEVFEATLITPGSRFDKYLKGTETALTSDEKSGLKLFIDNGCSSCHSGVNMGGDDYYAMGVVQMPGDRIMAGDKGRYKVTEAEADEFTFKSPSLRNIELTAPYFHSGAVYSLEEAVEVMNDAQIGANLSDADVKKIVAFLRSTTGVQPAVLYPVLPAPTDGTLKPSLD